MNVFEKANDELENFINNHLDSYHRLRNYDFGIKDIHLKTYLYCSY